MALIFVTFNVKLDFILHISGESNFFIFGSKEATCKEDVTKKEFSLSPLLQLAIISNKK